MSYDIEVKPASSNGYYTPAQGKAYYGSYSRDNYICHWWGAPGTVGTHDQTVAYIQGTAAAGTMSVNYVVSDKKITMLVIPENVSWGAESGNATGINVEHDPTLTDEGYKRAGWLKWHLEQQFGKQLGIRKHSDYFSTACPGTLDTDRIERECAALRNGGQDMITKDDIGPVRILMSEVEGWNGNDIHSGKYDTQIMAAWQGKDWKDMIWHGWNTQAVHRIQLETALKDAQGQIKDLQAKLQAAAGTVAADKLRQIKTIVNS